MNKKDTSEKKPYNGGKLEINWCGLCGGLYVSCPRCGNNTCNGGSGELENGEKCPTCLKAYDLIDKLRKTTLAVDIQQLLNIDEETVDRLHDENYKAMTKAFGSPGFYNEDGTIKEK